MAVNTFQNTLFYGAHLLTADEASECKPVQKATALVELPLKF